MPSLPEVIIVPETENLKVLQDLANNHLANDAYTPIQLDTSNKPESRGIDVGMLTRLPVVGQPVAYTINFKGDTELCGKTRDILQATLELPNQEHLHVFGVHFPSGRSPVICRFRALIELSKIANTLEVGSLKVAAGDFNFNCNETTSDAFKRLLYRNDWFAPAVISTGCDAPGSSKYNYRVLDNWHTWSYLDMILVSKELSPSKSSTKNWFADLGSFQTLAVHPEQVAVDEQGKGYIEPRRFDPVTGRGVSDHWPVSLRLLNRRSN